MQINRIQVFNINSPYSAKAPNQNVHFGNLTNRCTKDVYISAKHILALTAAYPKSGGIIGELPVKMIRELKTASPNNLSGKIKETEQAFSSAAKILKEARHLNEEADIDGFYKKYLNLLFSDKEKEAKMLLAEMINGTYFPKKRLEQILDRAEASLDKQMRGLGLLNEGESTKVKYLDSGKFGSAYSVNFIDKEGNSKFGKFALKVYCNPKEREPAHKAFQESLEKYSNGNGYTDMLLEFMNKYPTENVSWEACKLTMDLKSIPNLPQAAWERFQNTHGIYAEANAAKYIEGAAGGSINNTNIARTYFFDTKNDFSLSCLSDKSLVPPKHNIDIAKFGLANKDIKDDNFVCGRMVDYGAIVPQGFECGAADESLSVLVSDKTARQTYGKIRRTAKHSIKLGRAKYYELKEKAEKNKLPQSKSVLAGLKEAESFIF